MKKLLGSIMVMMVMFCGLVFSACTPNYDNVSITPSSTQIEMAVGQSHKFSVEINNAPQGMSTDVKLNNINNLFTIVTSQVEGNKVFYEIMGQKPGKTTVTAMTYEGNKTCEVQVEVFDSVTSFEAKEGLCIVAEAGNRYTLANQSYFDFYPKNCKIPQLEYRYNDIKIVDIIVQQDQSSLINYVKLVRDNGQILTDISGQELRFAGGDLFLTAQILDYTTGAPMTQIPAQEVCLQIVPQIKVGDLKLLRKGGIIADAIKYYGNGTEYVVQDTEVMTIIKNRISDSYLVFEIECDTDNVTMEIESTLCQCTQIASNNTEELETYVSAHTHSKFFSVQANDVGTETIKITLKYSPSTVFASTNYEETLTLNIVSITAPYQVNANNVMEYTDPIIVYDNAVTAQEYYVNVLDKLSTFSAVRVSLATKLNDTEFVESDEYYTKLKITYGSQLARLTSFEIPYADFLNNSSIFPIKVSAIEKYETTIYLVLTVVPPTIQGAQPLPIDVATQIPFEIKEGIKGFEFAENYLVNMEDPSTARALYLDIEEGAQTFDGFVISNFATATLGQFEFEYAPGADQIVKLEQNIDDDGHFTKQLTITPLKVGTAKIKIIAQDGYFLEMTFNVVQKLKNANLALLPGDDITSTKSDEAGNIRYVQVAFNGENKLYFSVVKQQNMASLYRITTEIDFSHIVDLERNENDQITLGVYRTCDGTETVSLVVRLFMQEIGDDFDVLDITEEGSEILFYVEIFVYSPVESVEFTQYALADDGSSVESPISAFSVYRKTDVGVQYATMTTAECGFRVTLKDGTVVEDVFNYYDAQGALSIITSYGPLVDNGTKFFINQFGSLEITPENRLVFTCDYQSALTGNFTFVITIKDYNVSYSAMLTVNVKTFTPLQYIGITNYQEQIYLSGTNDNYTFFTYMDKSADIQAFDVRFIGADSQSEGLVNVSVNADYSQVYVQHNGAVANGSGYLYFIPRTLYQEADVFPLDKVQKVKIVYSDGSDKRYPELISSAEEFMSAITETSTASKHYVIMNTIDLMGYSFENVKPLTGSISGGSPNAKITNVNLSIADSNTFGLSNYFGLFPRIAEGAEINDLLIEGTLVANIANLGVNRSFYIGLLAGENSGSINNTSIRILNASINLKDTTQSNKVYVGGMVGQNNGSINAGVDKVSDKDQLIFNFDDTKINLTTVLANNTFVATYAGQSQDTALGAIAGQNLGNITRETLSYAVFNNNMYSVNIKMTVNGFSAVGGVVGINGNPETITSRLANLSATGSVQTRAYNGVGGQNLGGVVGINYGVLNAVTTKTMLSAEDYVGGLCGVEYAQTSVRNCKVQAVNNAVYNPMITAISGNGNVGAFCGNERGTNLIDINTQYKFYGNRAYVYYELDLDNKISPILYNLINGSYQSASESVFEFTDDAIEIANIVQSKGTIPFTTVHGADQNRLVNMFVYVAENPYEQIHLNALNSGRDFPFAFSDATAISVTSLNPEILTIDAYGQITLYKPGLAEIQATSVLNVNVSSRLYINVVNAFDKMRIENMAGEEILTDAYINVYSHQPVSIKYSFAAVPIDVVGDMGQPTKIKLVEAEGFDAKIEYKKASNYYTRAEKYGNIIFFSSTDITASVDRLNTVVFTPEYRLTCQIDGLDVVAILTDFSSVDPNFTAVEATVLARLGTQDLSANFDAVSAEPVDELSLKLVQVTDDENDTLEFVAIKTTDDINGPKDYFKILTTTKTSVFDENTNTWTITHNLIIRFDYEKYLTNYEGQYMLTFTAQNGTYKTIIVDIETQTIGSISLKNLYDVDEEYDPSQLQSNQVSSGDYNLLEVSLYPFFADYDYLKIKNDPENYEKNNVLLMEVMALDISTNTLSLLQNVVYGNDGIIVSKSVIETQKFANQGLSRIFVKYTTISKATVDTVAKLVVSAIKVVNEEEVVLKESMVPLNIVVKDSVFFTINARQQAEQYYLAKGVSYDLTLNIHGFFEDQVKIEITHENVLSDVVSIQNQNGQYKLNVSKIIPYSAGSLNSQGYEIIITTYGESVVDGLKYQSGKSYMKIIIVDFVILQENISSYSINDDIMDFEDATVISGAEGAVVNLAIGSGYNLATKFVNGLTIEFDQTNLEVQEKIEEFEKNLTEKSTWKVTTTDPSGSVLGVFVESLEIVPTTKLSSGFMKINGMTVTPLRVNEFEDTKYFFTFDGNYYYELGQVKVGIMANSFNLGTDFVFDAFPNSTQENAIPVNTYQELMAMDVNGHYILMADITLENTFTPIQTQIASFDGNGHKITLPNYLGFEDGDFLGLFASVAEGTVLKNITVEVATSTHVAITLNNGTINFGMIAGENNGIITNCAVVGKSSYSQLSVTIPNQTSEYVNNYVAGLVGINNGYITNSYVSVNISAVANVGGLVGVNNKKIASCFVRDSMIVNKSAFSATHKTAGFAVVNGSSGNTDAQIIGSYVCGSTNSAGIYSVNTEKAINSMPTVSGFVYSNYTLIQDCYSDILINTSSTCAGFVFQNSGNVVRSYTTSTFSDPGQEAYIFVRSNSIDGGQTGVYEDSFYLVGNVNKAASKQLLDGLTELDDADFANGTLFTNYALSANINKFEGVWFYPSRDVETTFKKQGQNMKFTYGKPELVSANTIAYVKKVLDTEHTTVNSETGETIYAYIETAETLGSKLNPILIYSAQMFEDSIINASSNNINSQNYRLICDINYITEGVYNSQTFNTTYVGIFEGNGMKISGFSIDYRGKAINAGLFAQIGTGTANNGIIKNLTLTPSYINLPNVNCAGTLAGRLESGRVFNVVVDGVSGQTEGVKVIGQNAVGGVVGFASNSFKMQNIVSSVSANASYNYKKSNQNFNIYQSNADLPKVSYAGAIAGITNGSGQMVNISVQDSTFAIGEVCGIMFGLVGSNVVLYDTQQTLNKDQFITPLVYGGVITGSLYGTLSEVNVNGENAADFIKKSSTASSSAVAVGGLVGLNLGGTITQSNFETSLIWNNVSPSIVGGLVGEMIGGTVFSSHFTGTNMVLNASNNTSDVVEVAVGGVIGKITPTLSVVTSSKITPTNVRIEFVSSNTEISVNLVSILTVYAGGVVGQIVQHYDASATRAEIDGQTTIYKTLPKTSVVFNRVSTSTEITLKNIIYGGVLNSYVGGLIGAIYSDATKLYEGEVVMQDLQTQNISAGQYQSTSSAKLAINIVDNKSTAEINTYYGGIVGFGKTVETHTEVFGKYDSKTRPWGILLKNSQNPQNFTSPEFDGKWQDAEQTVPAVFKNTEFMSLIIASPITGNVTSNENENRLARG